MTNGNYMKRLYRGNQHGSANRETASDICCGKNSKGSLLTILFILILLLLLPSAVMAACPSGCECLSTANATAKWGEGKFTKCSPDICGNITTVKASLPTPKYCYRAVSVSVNSAPVALIDPPTPSSGGMVPFTVTLSGARSYDPDKTGTLTAFHWNFGDGTSGTSSSVSHTYNTAGTYTVTLTVTDNLKAQGSATVVISVGEPVSKASLTAAFTGEPRSGTKPLAVQFTDQSTGSPTSWLWDFGDGATSTLTNPYHTYLKAGTFSVKLKVSNSQLASEKIRPEYIVVKDLVQVAGPPVDIRFNQNDIDGDGIPNSDDPDRDGDGTDNSKDNCPDIRNADQADSENERHCSTTIGDCIEFSHPDGVGDACDNCPSVYNPDQADGEQVCTIRDGGGSERNVTCTLPGCQDLKTPQFRQEGNIIMNCYASPDGVGDACDICPNAVNPDQANADGDAFGDACDFCVNTKSDVITDNDADGVDDACDNCPKTINSDQKDSDNDGVGDACDNCINLENKDQNDIDKDGTGDACDDSDGDLVSDATDNCLNTKNANQKNSDADPLGDACDNCPHTDNPLIYNTAIDCGPDRENPYEPCQRYCPDKDLWALCQPDRNSDGTGDACDCRDGIQGPNEVGIDCGGSCGISCDKVKIEGLLLFEDADPLGNPMNIEPNNVPTGFKPIRYAKVSLGGEAMHTATDETGYFSFIAPRTPGKIYYIRVEAINYAANVQKDRDACNEYVWWDSDTFSTPQTGNINLGVKKVGITSATNVGLTGYWQEKHHHLFCGGDLHELTNVNSAYFNIAEDALLERLYADNPANRDDTDSIGTVHIQYPDNTRYDVSRADPFYDEIYLVYRDENGLDIGFTDETIFHEYAHYLSDQISENDWALSQHNFCSGHYESPGGADLDSGEFAWFEGFAEYMSALMTNKYRGPPYYVSQERQDYGPIENPLSYCYSSIRDNGGKNVEGAVCAMLWDLADEPASGSYPTSQNESFDTLSGEDAMIFKIFDTTMESGTDADAPDVCNFINSYRGWRNRYQGTQKAIEIDKILIEYNINCG